MSAYLFQEVVLTPAHPKIPPPKTAPFNPLSPNRQKSPPVYFSLIPVQPEP